MFSRIETFIGNISQAGSEQDLADILGEISTEMGFTYFALTHHVDVEQASRPAIRVHNYPSDWVSYFDREKLGLSDPVHRASQRTSIGFPWSALSGLIDLTPRDRQILALAERNGLGDGFTIPVHVPGEANGSCSFAVAAGSQLDPGRLPAVQLVGAFAFEAARRIHRMRYRDPAPAPRLTDRQRDCLLLAARGLSDKEIARALALRPETVIQYLKRARERFGVAKRTPLAVKALYDGIISFTDILER
jgi:LuxR family quorum-sensing system transcriptional regulator CciR